MKTKHRSLLWIATALLLFACPLPLHLAIGAYPDQENYENRTLAALPALTCENYKTFPGEMERYFSDHLPFRNEMRKTASVLAFRLLSDTASKTVFIGKDGFLFFRGAATGDGDNVGIYKGLRVYSEAQLDGMRERLLGMQAELAARGARLVVLVLPEKEGCLDRYMPDSIVRVSEATDLDALDAAMAAHADAPFVYPRVALHAYRDEYQLFFKYDTHMNLLGAFVAYQEVTRALYGEAVPLSDQTVRSEPLIDRPSGKRDLANMLMLRDRLTDEREYFVEAYPPLLDWSDGETAAQNARFADRLLIVGDSVRVPFLAYARRDFAVCKSLHMRDYAPELLDEFCPSVVLMPIMERHADWLLDWSFTE